MTVHLQAQAVDPTSYPAAPLNAPDPADAMSRGRDARQSIVQTLRDRVRSVYPK